jgi:plasmid stabilization system protein ParE
MPYQITRHPLVERDLSEINDLVSDYAGPQIGYAKTDEIVRFIGKLTDFPHIGTIRNEIHPGLRAIPASDKSTVCFTIDDDTMSVYVVCVSYAGADWQARVRERR